MALLTVKINDVEYRTVSSTLQISERVGQTASAKVDVLLDGKAIPVSWQRVVITDSFDNPVYTGLIMAVDSPSWSSSFETQIYPLNLKDLSVVFENRIINEAYQNKTTTEIVTSIFNNYLSEEGLTLGTIGTFTRTYKNYSASNLSIRKIFNELGDDVSAIAEVTPTGAFNFVDKTDLNAYTAPAGMSSLKFSESGRELATIQRLTGATEETDSKTVSTVWNDNDQDSFSVGYQISDITGITINGSPATFGTRGIDEDDSSITFLYKYGSNEITVNSAATTKPAQGDIVVTVYIGFFDIEIISEDEELKTEIASLSGTSGKIERVAADSSIKNVDDGQNLSDALLAEKAGRDETLSGFYNTSVLDESRPPLVWDFNFSTLGITGEYVITEREVSYFTESEFRIRVKLKNRNFYSRYGTVLEKYDKEINTLIAQAGNAVNKLTQIKNNIELSEIWAEELTQTTIPNYPATGSNLYEPANITSFYPL